MTFVFGHGAGAGQDHPWIRRLVAAFQTHGIEVVTFNFPYMAAGRRAPDRPAVLEAHFEQVWKEAAAKTKGPMIAGGKSMGGRIASQVAGRAAFVPPPAALAFFGYPLHPPNQPAKRRDSHLPHVTAPMLFLHGTRDPFGSPDEMRELVASLPRATLHLIDGGDHSLVVKRARASGASSDSVERAVEVAATWLKEHTT
jgi:predicted alpha/beta-hydrolase family hydrolase